ncbi:MAG: molybdopterin-guanine dinucleotide biosynthesis protein B [Candidatus Metalachnospira sp.]|nr:molybdopterin-guanine dinucleotide biosynthesis protein B [Candidatus Metalachnospira sp.]
MDTKKSDPFILAVSGVKNSGKTTLITKLIKEFNKNKIKVAVIKHDGHDFSYDVPKTDTFSCFEAGAYATAVFSNNKYMVVKKERQTSVDQLKDFFPEADIILLEGMKNSAYPKIEVIRKSVSNKSVVSGGNLLAIATDMTAHELNTNVNVVDINDAGLIAEFVYKEMNRTKTGYSAVILAGGKSSRMGRDKADLYINEKTFLEVQIDKLRNLGFKEILVSGYKGQNCDIMVVEDKFEKKGPLGGLYSCLNFMTNSRCLIVPVDVPLIPAKDLEMLVVKNKESNSLITVLSHNGNIEPLIGVYSKEYAEKIRAAIETNEYSVIKFIEKYGFDVYDVKSENDLYENINYYEEYIRIRDHI